MNAHLFIGPMEFTDPTLLISGDAQSLLWLAERIRSRQLTELHQGQPTFLVARRGVRLIPVDEAGRLEEQQGQYEWRIDERQALDFAERLRVLAQASGPGHAYLDTESPLQIMASKGEYDDLQEVRRSEST